MSRPRAWRERRERKAAPEVVEHCQPRWGSCDLPKGHAGMHWCDPDVTERPWHRLDEED